MATVLSIGAPPGDRWGVAMACCCGVRIDRLLSEGLPDVHDQNEMTYRSDRSADVTCSAV